MRALACSNNDKMPSVGGTERLACKRSLSQYWSQFLCVTWHSKKRHISANSASYRKLRGGYSSNGYKIPWLRDNLHPPWLSWWYNRIPWRVQHLVSWVTSHQAADIWNFLAQNTTLYPSWGSYSGYISPTSFIKYYSPYNLKFISSQSLKNNCWYYYEINSFKLSTSPQASNCEILLVWPHFY